LAQRTTSFINDLIELRIDRICLECANFDVGLVRELLRENRPGYNGQQNAPKQNRWHGRRITELGVLTVREQSLGSHAFATLQGIRDVSWFGAEREQCAQKQVH
jgi:hypothetical protein